MSAVNYKRRWVISDFTLEGGGDIDQNGINISGECIVEICSEIHKDNLNFTGNIQ